MRQYFLDVSESNEELNIENKDNFIGLQLSNNLAKCLGGKIESFILNSDEGVLKLSLKSEVDRC